MLKEKFWGERRTKHRKILFVLFRMKAVIILPIVSVATVYTSKRWHTGAHTSSLCLLLQPRSAESKAGEPGPCLGARRWLTLCSEGVRGATCSGEEHWGHATLKWPPLWHQGPGEDHMALPFPQPCTEEHRVLLPDSRGSCRLAVVSSGHSTGAVRAAAPIAA